MNTITVEKVYLEQLEQLRPLLSPPNLGFVPWDKIVRTFCRNKDHYSDAYIGLILKCDSDIIGFIGMVRSDRVLDGKTVEVANLTSFVVLPNHRGQGLKLLRALNGIKDVIFTVITPSDVSQKLMTRINGAIEQSDHYQILPGNSNAAKLWVETDKTVIKSRLSGSDSLLFEEHSVEDCDAVLLANAQISCLLLLKPVMVAEQSCLEILYYSNQLFFIENIEDISANLARAFDFKHVIIDCFDCPDDISDSHQLLPMALPKLVFCPSKPSSIKQHPKVPFMSLFSERTKMDL